MYLLSRLKIKLTVDSVVMPTLSIATTSEGSTDPPSSLPRRRLPALPLGRTDPHPPGFRALTSRVEKFSGRRAEDNF